MTYFTTALRHGNIARAAPKRGIAASVVATAIDQVEARFDLTLVTQQRSRGIAANASGRQVAQKFQRLLDDYDAVLAEGADLKQALGATLRIGCWPAHFRSAVAIARCDRVQKIAAPAIGAAFRNSLPRPF